MILSHKYYYPRIVVIVYLLYLVCIESTVCVSENIDQNTQSVHLSLGLVRRKCLLLWAF